MNNNNNGDFVVGVIIIFVAVMALIAWKFSNVIGVDVSTGTGVLIRLVMFTFCWIMVWNLNLFTFSESLPFFICSIWPVWWPVLDYWSEHSFFGVFGPEDPTWYATWQTKLLGFFVLAAIGYGIRKLIQIQRIF